MLPRVSALVLSRGRPERLRACLASIASQDYAPLDVHVLANGCAQTAEIVRTEFPDVALLETPENIGSAPGRNRVAREAAGEYLLFLDDDGEIRAPDTVTRLVAGAQADPRAGVLSMALFNAASDEPTGWRLSLGRLPFRCYHASFAGGACLFRRRAFEEAGGYCEGFSGPSEEFDLTVRVYGAGWAVVHFPEVAFHHHVTKDDEEWRRVIGLGYSHLQYVIWRLYPGPWHLPASLKALATQIAIDVRHHGARHVLSEVRTALHWMRRGRADRAPLSARGIELLYFAKYFRVDDWDTLETAPHGLLRRVFGWRLRRKRLGVSKLPLPGRGG